MDGRILQELMETWRAGYRRGRALPWVAMETAVCPLSRLLGSDVTTLGSIPHSGRKESP